jgi:hypothetical protein
MAGFQERRRRVSPITDPGFVGKRHTLSWCGGRRRYYARYLTVRTLNARKAGSQNQKHLRLRDHFARLTRNLSNSYLKKAGGRDVSRGWDHPKEKT